MNIKYTSSGLAATIWLMTSMFLAVILNLFLIPLEVKSAFFFLVTLIVSLAASLPTFLVMLFTLPILRKNVSDQRRSLFYFLMIISAVSLIYGWFPALADINIFENKTGNISFPSRFLLNTVFLFACACFSVLIRINALLAYFSKDEISISAEEQNSNFFNIQKTTPMDNSAMQPAAPAHSNRLMIKGLITGALILVMWIPTLFIQNLVTEREARQQEIVKEVSAKWASSQTVSGPFLSVPYTQTETGSKGEQLITKTHLIITAENMDMNGKIIPEERPRSIYKVLLYRSELSFSGRFKPRWPEDINPANLDLAHAKLCFSLSDFKGLEDDAAVEFNGEKLTLEPGVPVNNFGATGLSSPVNLTNDSIAAGVPFSVKIRIRGSGLLHFLPLGAKSKYAVQSTWPDPSFDGNTLPAERKISDSGFSASWNFNRANSSFGSVIREGNFPAVSTSFGVSLVQPADQYNKTMRCVKYAILFIGLTFALFFITEIMQKKPFHPVQYALVGIALVIFYSLLLSISEFILFDYAYLISAAATVLLISFYAKGHFKNWRSAAIMGGLLTGLYSFIFVLIRLEDTALLVGSIGLFVILALVMYASRKINWYGHTPKDDHTSPQQFTA